VSVLRGRHSRRLDDLQTLQAVHSQRPSIRPPIEFDLGAARNSRRDRRDWRARRVLDAHGHTSGRRDQFLEGLLAAQSIATDPKQCESTTAVADAWRKLKLAKKEDPEWDHAGKVTAGLETCRAAIAKTLSSSIGDLRHKQRLEQAETVRRSLQTQGFDTTVTLTGADKNEVIIAAPQLTGGMLDRITTNLSMGAGSFLEAWQKLGCVRVTFTNTKQKWAYDLPPTQEAVPDVSVLEGMGLGAPLALQ
jgi:hypothetical protein